MPLSEGCGNSTRHLSGAKKKKPKKIQFALAIVAVRDGYTAELINPQRACARGLQ